VFVHSEYNTLTYDGYRFKLSRRESSEDYTRRGRFEALAEYGYPDADEEHLKTCLAFLIWAFAVLQSDLFMRSIINVMYVFADRRP